jgi:hypothetical protein
VLQQRYHYAAVQYRKLTVDMVKPDFKIHARSFIAKKKKFADQCTQARHFQVHFYGIIKRYLIMRNFIKICMGLKLILKQQSVILDVIQFYDKKKQISSLLEL